MSKLFVDTPGTPRSEPGEGEERCQYCAEIRKSEDMTTAKIWRNGRQWQQRFCKDKPCAAHAQWSAEG